MKSKYSLVFIGEQKHKGYLRIMRKPSFYDAILLLNKSPQSSKTTPYHFISLDKNENISIHFHDKSIQFVCDRQTLQILASNRKLTETEAYNFFNNFVIKEKDKVSFLSVFPCTKTSPSKRKKTRVLSEARKLEENKENANGI